MLGHEGSIYFKPEEREFIRKWLYHGYENSKGKTRKNEELYASIKLSLDYADETDG